MTAEPFRYFGESVRTTGKQQYEVSKWGMCQIWLKNSKKLWGEGETQVSHEDMVRVGEEWKMKSEGCLKNALRTRLCLGEMGSDCWIFSKGLSCSK